MESAAGIGGLIKAILQLQKGMIAPHLNFEQPSSRIAWEQLPIRVPTALVPWPSQERKKGVAGVSSFGFAGTNAHLLLEAAPKAEPWPPPRQCSRHLLTISAKNERALKQLALSYSSVLNVSRNGLLPTSATLPVSVHSFQPAGGNRCSIRSGAKGEA